MISHYLRENGVIVGQPQDVCIYIYIIFLLYTFTVYISGA